MRRGLLLRVPKWPRVYHQARFGVNVRNKTAILQGGPATKLRTVVLLLLLLGSLLTLSASPEVVYVRNQRLEIHRVGGERTVQFDAFRKLLTAEEAQALKIDGETFTVTNPSGESRVFRLTAYGEFAEWESALQWLGYSRKESELTGVVDWVNSSAGAGSSAIKEWKEPTAEELARRKDASARRPGYRVAEKNYHQVMSSLGQGGTEVQRRWVSRLGHKIAAESPLADLHWTFDIAASAVPNALCTGEGFVVVTEGLLDLNLSDDEMAGVLGHEVAHGVRRHAQLFEERYSEARRLVTELRKIEREAAQAEADNDKHKLQTLRSRLSAMSPRLDYLADFIKNQQAYNQQEEEEADVQGMLYATAAGFDPYGEGRALIKLRNRSVELFGQAFLEGSRTHPPLKRRLEIQALVQKRWQAERDKPKR